jgi:hypothetical protein
MDDSLFWSDGFRLGLVDEGGIAIDQARFLLHDVARKHDVA